MVSVAGGSFDSRGWLGLLADETSVCVVFDRRQLPVTFDNSFALLDRQGFKRSGCILGRLIVHRVPSVESQRRVDREKVHG
jgi:hypothetical protein